MEDPFEFVVIDAPRLASTPGNPTAFEAHFSTLTASVVAFPNLGGDSVLVVPRPTGGSFPHLAAFLRVAPREQVDELWRELGLQVAGWLHARNVPLWVSTSGLAVPWLHLRLDARPKYYQHVPYTQVAVS